MNRNKKLISSLLQISIAIIFGLIMGAVVIIISKENPLEIYKQMFSKSFFTSYYFLQTLTRATPIIICAIATAFAWRAGYINIGVEGQMIVGGFVATVIGLYCPGPIGLKMLAAILGGIVAGGLYGLIAGFLNAKFNVNLVICTLMMNYIANNVVSYFVTFPLKAKSGDGFSIQTEEIAKGLRFFRISNKGTFNIGFIIAICVVLLLLFVERKTIFGYESKMTGLNKNFAKYGGVHGLKLMLLTMFLSGAIAGLAGICEIYGVKYRYIDGMFVSTSYAWTGLMAALIANLHPIGIFLSSIFLSGLQVGGQAIQRSADVPLQMSTVIQSSITLFISIKIAYNFFKNKKKNKEQIEVKKEAKEDLA